MNYVFNEDHASILESPAVLAQYNTLIDAFAKGTPAGEKAGGYLKIDFTYDYPLDGSRPRPILFLLPDGHEVAGTEIHLSPDDSGRRVGPFPAGDYTASLVAAAAKADRHHVPVSITNNETHDLSFTFRPDGMLYRHVVMRQDPEDRPAGMPAEQYLANDRPVIIEKVTLNGNGIERTVQPEEDGAVKSYDLFFSSADYCIKNYFHFFGLPAGEYEVEIVAKGFKPHKRTYAVKPGQPAATKAIELVPLQ
jgi:hypothetical protein